jgi:hypothetical protein
MRRSGRWKKVEGIQGQENGHGVESGLLCSCVMERNNVGIVLYTDWSGIDISIKIFHENARSHCAADSCPMMKKKGRSHTENVGGLVSFILSQRLVPLC